MRNLSAARTALGCCLLCVTQFWLGGCSSPHAEQAKLPAPAKVENAVKESEITAIKLTPEAAKRLGISAAEIEVRDIGGTLDASGEIVIPPGQTMMIAAPMAGTLGPAQDGPPFVGRTVKKGQTLLRLTPFLAPERDLRVQIERDIDSLTERINGIRQRKERAEILANEKAGSVRAAEEAQAELAVAEAELKGARERLARFDRDALNSDFSVAITAPISGTIQKAMAGTAEATTGGAALLEISDLSTVWVRVPVYVGDLALIGRGQSATVRNLGTGTNVRQARPVNAPPTADPNASTVDLYFALPNNDGSLSPGQRVGIALPLRSREQGQVIPWSAVLHDVNGNTWVYEITAPQTYVRRQVEVIRVNGGMAVLGRAPARGTKIVTAGAVELYGTEFGAGK